jgi:3-hydroxyisobutyrate dehydrogenase
MPQVLEGHHHIPTHGLRERHKLAQDAAAKVGASTPLGAQTEALFQMFNGLGYGGRDFSAILQMLRGQLDGLPKG